MKGEVFFAGFSYNSFVVGSWECNALYVWIPSIIGTHLMDHSTVCFLTRTNFLWIQPDHLGQ